MYGNVYSRLGGTKDPTSPRGSASTGWSGARSAGSGALGRVFVGTSRDWSAPRADWPARRRRPPDGSVESARTCSVHGSRLWTSVPLSLSLCRSLLLHSVSSFLPLPVHPSISRFLFVSFSLPPSGPYSLSLSLDLSILLVLPSPRARGRGIYPFLASRFPNPTYSVSRARSKAVSQRRGSERDPSDEI